MSFLDNIRLAPKVLSIPIVLCIAIAGMGYYAQSEVMDVAERTEDMYDNQVLPLQSLAELTESFQRSRGNLIEAAYVTDPAVRSKLLAIVKEREVTIKEEMDKYEPTIVVDKDRRAFDKVEGALAEFGKGREAFLAALAADDQASALQIWQEQCEPARTKVQDALDEIVTVNVELAKESVDVASAAAVEVRNLMIGGTFASVLIGMALGIIVSRGLAARAQELAGLAQRVALGEAVTVTVVGKDELSDVAQAFAQVAASQASLAVAATRVAAGDATVVVTPRGPQDDLSNAFVGLVNTTKNLTDDLQELVAAAEKGELSKRGDHSRFQGSYADIVRGINAMLDAMGAPIGEAATVLDRVAGRDMTARMTGTYEGEFDRIKTSINVAVGTLEESLQQVARAAEQVTSAAGQIASSTQAVAQGASEQASALEQTSASLETMASVTGQNAENASQADALARQAKTASDQGIQAMSGMNSAMERIRTSAEGTAAIIKDINEIAFQTNLLALNAAVEAARAGDAGRGFAVVAEEVRNLAMRSKEAARKTETLIQESVDLARQGEGMSRQVNTNLGDIVSSVGKVSAIVTEIAAASSGQARGILEVNHAVSEMEKVTQQNAANSEEAASAVEELSGQARELAGMVGQFELSGGGGSMGSSRSAPRQAAKAPPMKSQARPPAKPAHASGGAPSNGKPPANGKANGQAPIMRKSAAEAAFPLDDDPAFRDF